MADMPCDEFSGFEICP